MHKTSHSGRHNCLINYDVKMRIAIIGLGFVGLSLASVLAARGIKIVGIDMDKNKCKKISQGIAPFFEKDLEKILKNGLKKQLEISSDVSLVNDCDFIFVTVGTPQKSDGSIELSMIKKVINDIGENVKKFFSFSLNPFVLFNQLFNLSFILGISVIFTALIPVFSIYKTLFFCL